MKFPAAPLLSTLSEVQSKADMVKSFTLFYVGASLLSPSELHDLCGSLVAMRSLKHLKLNFPQRQDRDVILSLFSPVLKSCTFSLATLFIPSILVDDWILGQNQLQVLGMSDPVVDQGVVLQDRQLSICKQLSTHNSSPPAIFLIASHFITATPDLELDTIISFPVFSVNARWSAKDVVDSLPWKKPHDFSRFKLLFDSLSEEGIVHDVLTSLAEHFFHLEKIVLIINDPPIHFRTSSFSSLHKFPHLKEFRIEYKSGIDILVHAPFHENYFDLARSWATNCSELCEITFPDGWTVRPNESGDWVLRDYLYVPPRLSFD